MKNLKNARKGFTVKNGSFLKEECAGTLIKSSHNGHKISVFLNALMKTPEYLSNPGNTGNMGYGIPEEAFNSYEHEFWFTKEAEEIMFDLFDLLNDYAPEGYYFGCVLRKKECGLGFFEDCCYPE